VADIQQRQEGLERFVNRMKYQLIGAEEKFANIYYHFLQSQKHQLTKAEDSIEIVGDDSEVRVFRYSIFHGFFLLNNWKILLGKNEFLELFRNFTQKS